MKWFDYFRQRSEPKFVEPVFDYKPPEPVQEAPLNLKCHECGITLNIPGCYYCDVCSTIHLSVATPFFQLAHQEWQEENERRIQYKRSM